LSGSHAGSKSEGNFEPGARVAPAAEERGWWEGTSVDGRHQHQPLDVKVNPIQESEHSLLDKLEQNQAQENRIAEPHGRVDIIEQTGKQHAGHEDIVNTLQARIHAQIEPILEQIHHQAPHFNAQQDSPLSENKIMDHAEHRLDEEIGRIFNAFQPSADSTVQQTLPTDIVDLASEILTGQHPGHHVTPQDFITSASINDETNIAHTMAHLGHLVGEQLGIANGDLSAGFSNSDLGALLANGDFSTGITGGDFGNNSGDPNNPLNILGDFLNPVDNYSDPFNGGLAQISDGIINALNPYSTPLEDEQHKHHKHQEEKTRHEHEQRVREEEAKRYAAAMLAALKARQAQEEANRVKAQKDLLNLETRHKYIVMKGDTLESIAQKRLFNKRLAILIYEINKSKIPLKVKEGKRLLQLKPRLVLLLPTTMEVKRFQTKLFGRNGEKFEYDLDFDAPNAQQAATRSQARIQAIAPTETAPPLVGRRIGEPAPTLFDEETAGRRVNVESLLGKFDPHEAENDGRIKYTCRLGDTLRSVAMRHPALKEVTLWKLLASVNGISSETDQNGCPIAELKRGLVLELPSPEEVAEFREQQNASASLEKVQRLAEIVGKTGRKNKPTSENPTVHPPASGSMVDLAEPAITPLSINPSIAENLIASQSASKLQAESSAATLREEDELAPVDTNDEDQYNTNSRIYIGARNYLAKGGKTPTVLPGISQSAGFPQNRSTDAPRNEISQLSSDCRVVCFGSADGDGSGYRARLEFKQNEFWLPVILYEINFGESFRYEYSPKGSRKTKRIDLPAPKAKQLAFNDLSKNWQQYSQKFTRSN